MQADNHIYPAVVSPSVYCWPNLLFYTAAPSHHTHLLQALNIAPLDDLIKQRTLSTFHKVMQYDSPARDLELYLLAQHALGRSIDGTIVARISSMGLSPLNCVFSTPISHKIHIYTGQDGYIDSLRYLLHHSNFIKPYSEEHVITKLLTRSF